MVELLLEQGSPLETQSEEGFPPLWYALQELSDETREMAIQVIRKGASTNTVRKSLFRLRAECWMNRIVIFFSQTKFQKKSQQKSNYQ